MKHSTGFHSGHCLTTSDHLHYCFPSPALTLQPSALFKQHSNVQPQRTNAKVMASNLHDPFTVTDNYSLALHHVKMLFLAGHYRQCIQTCHQLLQTSAEGDFATPLIETFLFFYLGLAHDELARLMHSFSHAKLSAFDQAEIFYKKALAAIPSRHDAFAAVQQQHARRQATRFTDPYSEKMSEISTPTSPPFHYHLEDHLNQSPSCSPQHLFRNDSIPSRSPRSPLRVVYEHSVPDFSDDESHGSFGDIMTPSRVLNRDYSRISLLDPVQKRTPDRLSSPMPLQRDLSRISLVCDFPQTKAPSGTSQGLPRTIRKGSPPPKEGRYRLSPRLPHVDFGSGRLQRPRVLTHGLSTPPGKEVAVNVNMSNQMLRPVSPLDSESDGITDASTISPTSMPETPCYDVVPSLATPPSQSSQFGHSSATVDIAGLKLDEHFVAFRRQLCAHVLSLSKCRHELVQLQCERAAARTSMAPTKGTPLKPTSELDPWPVPPTAASKSIAASRSFWSFTPVEVQKKEKQNRIAAGRERNWARERFNPRRYQELADRALAEL